MMSTEVELNDRMVRRGDVLDNMVYHFLLCLLELNEEQAQEKFPWDILIIREVLDATIEILGKHKKVVCNPYIVSEGDEEHLCRLSECGCEVCNYQEN